MLFFFISSTIIPLCIDKQVPPILRLRRLSIEDFYSFSLVTLKFQFGRSQVSVQQKKIRENVTVEII